MNKMSRYCYRPGVGLLLVRFIIGAVLVQHGWEKAADMAKVFGLMAHLGWPAFIAYVIVAIELVGGLMLIFGVLPRPVAVVVAVEMIVALVAVAIPMRGWGGSDLELMLLFSSLGIAFAGAGSWSLMRVFEHDGSTAVLRSTSAAPTDPSVSATDAS
ncbi:MAG TPA: DoxX family protein [Candidatus Paceibacterota bacterium]|nr:DoxX family protein [Candidatus Paceibacterota bacterium]